MYKLAYLWIVSLLLLVVGAPIHLIQDPSSTPEPLDTSDSQEVREQAEDLMRSAEIVLSVAQGTTDQSTAVLNHVQAVFNLVSIAVVAIGFLLGALGWKTINDYRGRYQELTQALETSLVDSKNVREAARKSFEESFQNMQQRVERSLQALTLLQLAENQLSAGNHSQVVQTYQEAFALDPANQTINYRLAELYLIQRDITQAIKHIDYCLAVNPRFAPALASKAYALRLQANTEDDQDASRLLLAQAEVLLLEALDMQPNLRNVEGEAVYGILGGVYRRQGRYNDAISAFSRAATITPRRSYPIVNLASIHALQGNVQEATSFYNEVLKLCNDNLEQDPSNQWARIDRAFALLYLGKAERALTDLKDVCESGISVHFLAAAIDLLQSLNHALNSPPGYNEAITLLDSYLPTM